MLYRKLDANGDYTFGQDVGNFYQDSPEAVAQAVLTRLKLIKGEWILDTTEGTDWQDKILGMGRQTTYDSEIQRVILGTTGVVSIETYASGVDRNTRKAIVYCVLNTQYGTTTIQGVL